MKPNPKFTPIPKDSSPSRISSSSKSLKRKRRKNWARKSAARASAHNVSDYSTKRLTSSPDLFTKTRKLWNR